MTAMGSPTGFNAANWDQQLASLQKEVGEIDFKLQKAKSSAEINDAIEGQDPKKSLTNLIFQIFQGLEKLKKVENQSIPFTKVFKAFQKLQTYATDLQDRAEKLMHAQLRTDAAVSAKLFPSKGKVESHPSSIKDLCQALKKNYIARDTTDFEEVLGRHLGVKTRSFSREDLLLVLDLEKKLQVALKGGVVDAEKLRQVQDLLTDIKQTIKQAFTERIGMINAMDLNLLSSLKKQNPLQLACGLHDFYWDFHNPLEAHMEFYAFVDLYDEIGNQDELRDFFAETPLKANPAVMDALRDFNNTRFIRNTVLNYEGLSDAEKIEVDKHKIEYLKTKIKAKQAYWSKMPQGRPNVVILGGGPGGLTRLLAAGLEGVNVKLVEKRAQYERPMVIQLMNQPILNYFGVIRKMEQRDQYNGDDSYGVAQIMHLEQALESTAIELFGKEPFIQGEPVDVRYTQRAGKEQTFCLIKIPGKTTLASIPANVVVDATGARAEIARMLDMENPHVLTKPIAMVVGVLKPLDPKVAASKNPPISTMKLTPKDIDCISLTTPKVHYVQVQAKGPLELKITQLVEQSEKLKLQIAEQGEKGKKDEEIAKLEKQKKDIDDELSLITREMVELAADGEGLSNCEIVKTSPFMVQISKRKPATLVGNTVVMQSGDAFVKADPKTGLGANTAIYGAYSFIKAIQDLKKGNSHVDAEIRLHNFSFAAEHLADLVVETSKKVRTALGDTFATWNYAMTSLTKDEVFNKKELNQLQSLYERGKLEQLFTDEEKEALKAILSKWEGDKKDRGLSVGYMFTVWYDTFNQELMAMKKHAGI